MKKRLNLEPYEIEVRMSDEETGKVEIKNTTYSTLNIKNDYAAILGNSKCGPREAYERNKLADKIAESVENYFDFTVEEFKKLEDSLKDFQGNIPRMHKELLYRVYEAKEITDN